MDLGFWRKSRFSNVKYHCSRAQHSFPSLHRIRTIALAPPNTIFCRRVTSGMLRELKKIVAIECHLNGPNVVTVRGYYSTPVRYPSILGHRKLRHRDHREKRIAMGTYEEKNLVNGSLEPKNSVISVCSVVVFSCLSSVFRHGGSTTWFLYPLFLRSVKSYL